HQEAAAGIMGLLNLIVQVREHETTCHLHYSSVNAKLSVQLFDTRICTLNSRNEDNVAGVSSFGLSGTNSHAIISNRFNSTSVSAMTEEWVRPHSLPVSAKTATALLRLIDTLSQVILNNDSAQLIQQLCEQREHFQAFRATFSVTNNTMLKNWELLTTNNCQRKNPTAAFLCSGHGAEFVNVAKTMYRMDEDFRDNMDSILYNMAASAQFRETHIGAVLYPDEVHHDRNAIHQCAIAQPVLFAVEETVSTYLAKRNLFPNIVAGHSAGEVAAASTCGVLSRAAGCQL
ncbi:MAG: acyltransferase domain-containing protein, partial [Mesoflavibacter sp.]|nr:acyltransferase domain-containing protein [Mesoflavibacter sp.]